MATYAYKALPALGEDARDIYMRLLHLPPGEKTGTVSCTISEHLLSEAPEYEAVSYAWGSPSETAQIVCDDKTLQVPKNLNYFLLRTRAKGRDRTLWVDSICINQNDVAEKSSQVAAMGSIYRKASHVLIWLGVEKDNSTLGLECAQEMSAKFKKSQDPTTNVATQTSSWSFSRMYNEIYTVFDPKWAAFFALFDRPYWTRAWVIQEIAVSKNQWIICGDKAMEWRDLIFAYTYLITQATWLLEFYGSNNVGVMLTLQISQIEVINTAQPLHYSVLLRHRVAMATDPKDKIFAYHGTSARRSLEEHGIKPDYSISTEDLYLNLAVSTLRRATNLDFLDVPRMARQLNGLPSWVPFWEVLPGEFTFSLLQLEVTVPLHEQTEVSHNATKGSIYTPIIDDTLTRLELLGYAVDRIIDLTNPWEIQDVSGYSSLLRQAQVLQKNQRFVDEFMAVFRPFSNLRYPTAESREEATWQTCLAGIFSGSKDQTRELWRNFMKRQYWLLWIPVFHLQNFVAVWYLVVVIGHLLRGFGIRNPELPFRALTNKLINRRAAATLNGYIGLVPALAQVGDHIVLAKGGKLPLILRPKGQHWELIGDCYMHGMMQGELWDEGPDGQFKCEKIIVV